MFINTILTTVAKYMTIFPIFEHRRGDKYGCTYSLNTLFFSENGKNASFLIFQKAVTDLYVYNNRFPSITGGARFPESTFYI